MARRLLSFPMIDLHPVLEHTAERVGLNRHTPDPQFTPKSQLNLDNYYTLTNPPASRPDSEPWASNIYHGIVPAKNIALRDFAINGAVVRLFSSRSRASLSGY
jgi:hypothetical protein